MARIDLPEVTMAALPPKLQDVVEVAGALINVSWGATTAVWPELSPVQSLPSAALTGYGVAPLAGRRSALVNTSASDGTTSSW
jgi:hypothetical protein